MKYSVVKVVNGNYAIASEHGDEQSAIMEWHNQCRIHWNAPDVTDATIAILDENLDAYQGYKEHIHHDPVVEETTEEVTTEEE